MIQARRHSIGGVCDHSAEDEGGSYQAAGYIGGGSYQVAEDVDDAGEKEEVRMRSSGYFTKVEQKSRKRKKKEQRNLKLKRTFL